MSTRGDYCSPNWLIEWESLKKNLQKIVIFQTYIVGVDKGREGIINFGYCNYIFRNWSLQILVENVYFLAQLSSTFFPFRPFFLELLKIFMGKAIVLARVLTGIWFPFWFCQPQQFELILPTYLLSFVPK